MAGSYRISRTEQDEFALESQRRAESAVQAGMFAEELIPMAVGAGREICRDETPRSGVTLEQLAQLKPAFIPEGTVTAGTSSGITDGAAAMSVASGGALSTLGLEPLARVVATAVAGVDPSCMGLGPIPATRKALQRAGLTVDQLDLIELNEAFAPRPSPASASSSSIPSG